MDGVLPRVQAQLALEEGSRLLVYDDATGRPFRTGDTLRGKLSVGIGLNLMVPFDPQELRFIEDFRLGKALKALSAYAWFTQQDAVRQTALADIAYNLGVAGLLHWPKFLFFMANKDYPSAVEEIRTNDLWISQVHAARAGRLETMILTGSWPPDVTLSGDAA